MSKLTRKYGRKLSTQKVFTVAALAGLAALGAGKAQAQDAPITPTLGEDASYTLTQVEQATDNSITLYKYDNTGITEAINYEINLKQTTYGEGDGVKYFNWTADETTGNYTYAETVIEQSQITAKYDTSNPQTRLPNSTDISSTPLVGNFINQNATVSSSVYGGAISNKGTIGDITGSFIDNYSKGTGHSWNSGGAIYNGEDAIIGNITGDFIGNRARDKFVYGGAISNYYGTIGNITGDFIGNYGYSETSYAYGGAIYNNDEMIGNITGNFIGNYTYGGSHGAGGGAIYNEFGQIGVITGSFIGNYVITASTSASGGAITSRDGGSKIGNITGDFIGNYVVSEGFAYGGALMSLGSSVDNITGDFIGNHLYGKYLYGGAIDTSGTIANITGNFINNYSIGEQAKGGAINNGGTISSITGDFYDNHIITTYEGKGGVLYNAGTVGNITGNFIGNYVQTKTGYGGVISTYDSDETLGNITGNFIGNYVKGTSSAYGGVIYTRMSSSKIGDITGKFIDNYVASAKTAQGGVIYSGGVTSSINGEFIGNYAKSVQSSAYGGVIYNDDSSKLGSVSGSFINNYALGDYSAYGGVIYNYSGKISDIEGDFIGNYSKSTSGTAFGGVVSSIRTSKFYAADIGDITGNFSGNYVEAKNRAMGGVIYNCGGKYGDISGVFEGNYAKSINSSSSGGVLYNINNKYSDGIIGAVDSNGNIVGGFIDAQFINNYVEALNGTSQGGVIYNAGTISVINSNFIDNYVIAEMDAQGGAIYNTGTLGAEDENGNVLGGIINSTFTGNYAKSETGTAQGGAIYNTGSVSIVNSSFIDNYAKSETGIAQGGAIYNTGILNIIAQDGYTSVFSGNYTESAGVKDNNAIVLDGPDSVLNFNLETGGKILLQDNISSVGYAFEEFLTNNGVASYEEFARNQGYKDTATDTFLSNVGYSTVDEYARSQGYKDTPTETFLASTGYSTLDEALRAEGFGDTPTETYLNMTGYTSLDVMVQDAGYESVDAFLAEIGYETFDEALKAEMNLYGDTPEEQFLNMSGCATFEEYLKNEQNLYGDTPEEQFVYKEGYESFEAYLKAKEKLSGNTPEEQFLYKEGYKTFEDYLKANGYNGLPTVNIQGDDINNTTFYLFNDIHRAYVNMGNTTINTINNQVHNYDFWSLTLTSDTNMVVDVDLKNKTMDRFSAYSYGEHQGNLNVTGMNLLSDAISDKTEILFAEQGLKDNVVNGITTQLPDDKFQTTLFTPIYKYNVTYDNRDDAGYFVFAGGPKADTTTSEAFNPAVLGSSSTATVGALGTINQTFNYAFANADTTMNIPYLERISMRDRNKYALSITGDATDMGRFSPLYQPSDESSSVWVKPYATFENVPLKNGPKVSNITYGTLVGFDSEMQSLRRGWDRVWTGYIGYNGASQRYSGIDSTQNGGLIGGTMTLYKGNFFNATTVSVGANVANNQTMYGSEDFAMLLSGIGNKTGYNFEFKGGKCILQPSLLMSYTFVNTFDYTNAAGVKIDNKPLHALQLAPGVKVIGNLKNGWQPYASVSMVWNLMGESDATANGVKLPEMSIKPYVQYGVGLQKRIKDHFMAYGQAMVQNGGRNGVSLTAGFRWALGHDCKYEKTQRQPEVKQNLTMKQTKSSNGEILKQVQDDCKNNEILRSAQNDYKYIGHPEEGEQRMKAKAHLFNASRTEGSLTNLSKDSSRVSHVQNDGGKRILKQMTPEQRAAYGGKYYNTSRTAKSGSLRQY